MAAAGENLRINGARHGNNLTKVAETSPGVEACAVLIGGGNDGFCRTLNDLEITAKHPIVLTNESNEEGI